MSRRVPRRPRVLDRCTGDCCRSFTFPVGPEELKDLYEQWADIQQGDSIDMGLVPQKVRRLIQDIHLIYPMVKYLGRREMPNHFNPSDEFLQTGKTPKEHIYTCKHFDGRNCTIYDIRPRMCRRYPYNSDCNYEGCTWGEKRAKRQTKKQIEERRKNLPIYGEEKKAIE